MNLFDVENYLFEWNDYEKQQFATGTSINDILDLPSDDDMFDHELGVFRLPKEPFFKGSNVYLSKHNRFAKMVEHVHDFIEINYVYSGQCTQTINGKKVLLPTGTVCVLDRDVLHSIDPLGKNDILINILLNDQTFSSLFLFQLEKENSLLGKFLSDAFTQQAEHNSYMVFDTLSAPHIHTQIQLMLREYLVSEAKSEQFISQYLQLIISELMRIYQQNSQISQKDSGFDYIAVLDYIDEHYQTMKLSDLSTAFNYNSNYISNSLKKITGKNFQEILLEKKLLIARDLLRNSDLAIERIAEVAGFNSTSYFYRQFKKTYQETPKQFRSTL